jgi:hypothetical protein
MISSASSSYSNEYYFTRIYPPRPLALPPGYYPLPLAEGDRGAAGMQDLCFMGASKPEPTPDLTPDSGASGVRAPAFASPTLDTSGADLHSVAADYMINLMATRSPSRKGNGCIWGAIGNEREQRIRDSVLKDLVRHILGQDESRFKFTSSMVVLALHYAKKVFDSSPDTEMSRRKLFLGCLMVANKVCFLSSFLLLSIEILIAD